MGLVIACFNKNLNKLTKYL